MEFLKEVLGDELYSQVSEKLKGSKVKLADLSNGDYVDKNKFTALEGKLKDQSDLLTAANKQIEDFKGMDVDKIKATADEYKQKYEDFVKDTEAKENTRLFNEGLDKLLTSEKYNVKDLVSLKAHLNMDAITRDGENFIGLEDQIKPLRDSKDWLFNPGEGEPNPQFTKPNQSDQPPAGGEMKFNFAGVRPRPTQE